MEFPSLPLAQGHEVGIAFESVDVELPDLDVGAISLWILAVAKTYGHSVGSLTYVFCSDTFLYQMNVDHLDHDTLTDIITFDLRDTEQDQINGECYISLDRVFDNASTLGELPRIELLRVIIHGLLHLCGLGDKSPDDAEKMRLAEDAALVWMEGKR